MCKFQTPNVPQGATADERRAIMFNALKNLDLSNKCEKRESLIYLSWSNAWSEFKSAYPSATSVNTMIPKFGSLKYGNPFSFFKIL